MTDRKTGLVEPPAEIFKAYDIRGLCPGQIDGEVAYGIGRAYSRVIGTAEGREGPGRARGLRLALGHDMRHASPGLAERFRQGMIDEGVQVIDVGRIGTEMLYYAIGSRDLAGGASVTASHNPKRYNGFKLIKRHAVALSGDAGIQDVRRVMLEEDFSSVVPGGSVEEIDIYDEYRRHVSGLIDTSAIKPMRVVLDGMYGMAGVMIGPVLDALPIEQLRQNFEPDPDFPVSAPNPMLEENRVPLIERVKASGAQLGIAWDGDADRCFLIDEHGEFVPGDFLTVLFAVSMLKRYPRATILYDVRASRAVPDSVEAAGGTALMNRVGHAFFKTRMRDTGAVFGGEVSGHYYFKDFWNADSGMIPALLALELVSESGRSLAELLEPLREKYFISGEINSEVADQQAKMEEIERMYGDGKITHLDGVSVDYPGWHFNVRPSNTEPLLRLNLEAFSEQEMERRRDEVLAVIRS